MKNLKSYRTAIFLAVLMLLGSYPVFSTDGYFSIAYGTRAKGLAGAGSAYYPTSLVGGNPAGNVFLGDKYTVGLALFNPQRQFTVTGNPSGMPGTFGLYTGTYESDQKVFAVPNLAGNWNLNEDNAIAFALYGNGGMNTNYANKSLTHSLPDNMAVFHDVSSDATGVNLSQMFGEFTYSRLLADKYAIGFSAIFGYQMFKAYGLNTFGQYGMSADPENLSNNGMDHSFGAGFKIGYMGELFEGFSFGGTFQSPIFMSKFDKYSGLFAEQGKFDIPMNWTIGLSYVMDDNFAVMADYKRIHYSLVRAVSNPMDPMALPPAFLVPGGDPMNPSDYIPNQNYIPLGSDEGSGFGWEDVNVIKVGVEYLGVPNWVFRAGYSWCTQPVQESEVLFNILAPGVVEHHLALGLTKVVTKATGNCKPEINFAFNYAFNNTVSGYNPMDFDPATMMPIQKIDLSMRQLDFEIGITF